jgi:hypothetical protein
MFESVGDNAKRECLDFRLSLLGRSPVSQGPRQIDDFGDPSSICFSLELNLESNHDDRFYLLRRLNGTSHPFVIGMYPGCAFTRASQAWTFGNRERSKPPSFATWV